MLRRCIAHGSFWSCWKVQVASVSQHKPRVYGCELVINSDVTGTAVQASPTKYLVVTRVSVGYQVSTTGT